ncbi:uncharacterized protein LOC120643064 isoform X2 [Panicum virgatum]|uniref:uncharacterized protein LOC120643064 isoform X2 n=1 Tax=Panicum virgatum TaxID=38727 RepID=UPI0019D4F6AD|nr:uncharacterized protein LOC120643064 isoform X2 [Panicum virgatum]
MYVCAHEHGCCYFFINRWFFRRDFYLFEDKSRAINGDGVDSQLVDLINKWHKPGMNLCVGKPEYKTIIESVLVNEKIFLAACALFHCDADDEKKLGLLRDAGLYIRDISGIACEDWDVMKLAIAVKVICCPKEELTDFHEVLAEDVVSKLKGDAPKYKGVAVKVYWLNTYHTVVSNHRLRIAKKKMLGSLVRKAKKAYEAEQAEVCDKVKLHGESQQIAQDHVTSVSRPTILLGDPTILAGEVIRRSPRLNRKLHENSGGGTPHKRPKY